MVKIEKDIKKGLEERGYKVLKNGWPDFLIQDPSGQAFFIEAKADGDTLKPNQAEMLQALASLKLNVLIVSEKRPYKKINLYNIGKVPDKKQANKKKLYDLKNALKSIGTI